MTDQRLQAKRAELIARIEAGEMARKLLQDFDGAIAGELLRYKGAKDFMLGRDLVIDAPSQGFHYRRSRTEGPPVSRLAEKILMENGPMHVKDLVVALRDRGWISTGIDKMDVKNITQVLSQPRKVMRFKRVGRGVFAARQEPTEAAV